MRNMKMVINENGDEEYIFFRADGEYIYKPAYKKGTNVVEPFRAYAEEAGYKVQKIVDPDSAVECEIVEVDGVIGTVRKKINVDVNQTQELEAFQRGTGSLSEEKIRALLREYITDYLLCNFDSHSGNFIVGEDGVLRGINKGQSFKYIGESKGKNATFSINYNESAGKMPSIYKTLFDKISKGEISTSVLDCLDEYVERLSSVSKEEYMSLFKKYTGSIEGQYQEDLMLMLISDRKEGLEYTVSELKHMCKEKCGEEESLESVINRAMIMPHIVGISKDICNEDADMEKNNQLVIKTINYCNLTRTTSGLEDFVAIEDNEEAFKFLTSKVAEFLGIEQKDIQPRIKEIYEYMYNRCVYDGYVYHATNSVAGEGIREHGLSGVERPWSEQELLEINRIYESYGVRMSLGWVILDIKNHRHGWFYDESPTSVIYYAGSPEWMNQFCGKAGYYDQLPRKQRNAFNDKNYENALENITWLQDRLNFTQDDRQVVLKFFDKYWKLYEKSTPELVMVPKEEVKEYIRRMPYHVYRELFQEEDDDIGKSLSEYIVKGRCPARMEFDQLCEENVSAENALFIDITSMIRGEKSNQKESNGQDLSVEDDEAKAIELDEIFKLIEGFDVEQRAKAKEIIMLLEKGIMDPENIIKK